MMHPGLQIIREEHAAMTAVITSLAALVERGPDDEPIGYFESLRTMLFYLEEFPDRLHHARESRLLFPKLAQVAPELSDLMRRLDAEHHEGVAALRRLQNLLLGWELIGEDRHDDLTAAMRDYVHGYLEHIRVEETQLLPVAEQRFTTTDWDELECASHDLRDPHGGGTLDAMYARLLSRVVLTAPMSVAGAIGRAVPHTAPSRGAL